jgi:hypothetical protein
LTNAAIRHLRARKPDFDTQIRDVIVPKYESMGDNVFFVDGNAAGAQRIEDSTATMASATSHAQHFRSYH